MPESLQPPESDETESLYALIRDSHLLTSVVLIGASALIPIPFMDDVTKAYLEKRLFGQIAERQNVELSKDERHHLTQHDDPSGCCALGCLGSAVLYPIKRILRKLFFFLEIKRAVDQSTTALAQAWLFQLTLKKELWKPGQDIAQSHTLRKAIRSACHSQGVKPLETAIRHGFQGAKGTLADFAAKFTKQDGSDEEHLAKAVDKLETERKDELAGLTQRLSDSLDEVSDTYLERFAREFEQQLAVEKAKPQEETSA